METKRKQRGENKQYVCESCDYTTPVKCNYDKHITTENHLRCVKLTEKYEERINLFNSLKPQLDSLQTNLNSLQTNLNSLRIENETLRIENETLRIENEENNEKIKMLLSKTPTTNIIENVEKKRNKIKLNKIDIVEEVCLKPNDDDNNKIKSIVQVNELVLKPASEVITRTEPQPDNTFNFELFFQKMCENPEYNDLIKQINHDDDEPENILKSLDPCKYSKGFHEKYILKMLEEMNDDDINIKCTDFKRKKFIIYNEEYSKDEMKKICKNMIDTFISCVLNSYTNSRKLDNLTFSKIYSQNKNSFMVECSNELIMNMLIDEDQRNVSLKHLLVDMSNKFSNESDSDSSEDEKQKKKNKKNKKKYNSEESD